MADSVGVRHQSSAPRTDRERVTDRHPARKSLGPRPSHPCVNGCVLDTATRAGSMSQLMGRHVVRGGVPSGLSIALALLPKCPLCIMAHASVVGGAGLGAGTAAWMRVVAAGAMVLAVALLAWRAGTRRGYGPFALGCVGAVLVLADVFHLHPGAGAHAHHAAAAHSHGMLWMGIAVMVSASVWNAWPRRAAPACHAAAHC